MEKLEKLLKTQLVYINHIVINVEFMLGHDQIQRTEHNTLIGKAYIPIIARLASSETIINLFKLFWHKEEHSFYVLKNEVSKKRKLGMCQFVSEIKDKEYNAFLTQFELGKKLFKEMKIYDIRNKYVGHLDYERLAINFNLESLENFKLILEKISSNLSQAFFDEIHSFDSFRNQLKEVLIDNIK